MFIPDWLACRIDDAMVKPRDGTVRIPPLVTLRRMAREPFD